LKGQFGHVVATNHGNLNSETVFTKRPEGEVRKYITYVTNPYTANPAIWRAAPHFAAFDTAWRASTDRSNATADWLAPGPQGALTRFGTAGKGLYSNPMGELRRDDDFVSATMNATWRISDKLELISLTGYNRLSSFAPHAVSGTPFEFSVFVDGGKTTNFFQELRLQGETSRLEWTVGGYYARDTVKGQAPGLFDDLATVSNLRGLFNAAQNCAAPGGGTPGSLVSGAGTGLPGGCVRGPGGTFNPNGYTAAEISEGFRNGASHGNQKGSLWSLFAHVDYKLTDTLSMVGGVRYSEQLQTGTSCAGTLDPTKGSVFSNQYYIWNTSFRYLYYIRNAGKLPPPGPVGPTGCITYDATTNSFGLVSQRLDENNVAWQAGLNWKFADNQLLYATVSKGFLAGVLPSTSSNSAVQLTPVKQEQLTAFEAGAKLSLLDRKVRATVSGFYYDYRDKQVNAFFPDIIFTALPVLINIPKSRAYGIDASLSAKLSPALEATLSGTWLETEVTELPACVGTQLFGCGRDSRAQPLDYKGFEFAYAPSRPGNNAPFRGGKTSTLEGGIRVPFVMKWPAGIKPGVTINQPVSTLDILPTIAAAANVAVTARAPIDGKNLLPLINGGTAEAPHDLLFWKLGPQSAVRRGKWKLWIDNTNKIAKLYDLENDLGETRDLSDQEPAIKSELMAAYDAWNASLPARSWTTVSPVIKRRN
jgi:outer membrane receptor protein involved in Fe transport